MEMKTLKITDFDRETIIDTMQSQLRYEECYLDTETGQLILGEEGQEQAGIENIDDARYFTIPYYPSREGFRLMTQFAQSAEMPESLRDDLLLALEKTKPFRRFRDALHTNIPILNAFEAFKSERIGQAFTDEMESYGFQVEFIPTPQER